MSLAHSLDIVPLTAAESHLSEHRRRRSSSLGEQPDIPTPISPPPVPPISLTSRSSSANLSHSSRKRSGISSIIRRKTSSFSRRSDTPPSSYPQKITDHRTSMTSLDPPPLCRSSSRGFHLPSLSHQSPYHPPRRLVPGEGDTPRLPHSSSFASISIRHSLDFPAPPPRKEQAIGNDSESETEKEAATPKRRRRIRPVSAQPPPRKSSLAGRDALFESGNIDRSLVPVSPKAVSFVSNGNDPAKRSISSVKKLDSLPTKQRENSSSGSGVQTISSSFSDESRSAEMGMQTEIGLPPKALRNAGQAPVSSDEEDVRAATRSGSVSAPNSIIKPPSPILATRKEAEKQRRRQSWNDLIIPREIMKNQKRLKEGSGALKLFATGVESESSLATSKGESEIGSLALKGLVDQHDKMQYRMDVAEDLVWKSLEAEFAGWWEMAIVLIEHAKTGQEPSASSPTQSRPVTLTIDKARTADPFTYQGHDSEMPWKIGLSEHANSSLDPEPPRASPAEQWRPLSGRQDLSQRHLDMLLRAMLRTPVMAVRPNAGSRQASTHSSSSTTSSIILPSRYMQSPVISLPSSGNSAYIMPNPSDPSPPPAEIPVRPTVKKRDSSITGLAGLKEFLRSLKPGSRAKLSTPLGVGVATFFSKSESHFPYFSHVGTPLLATDHVPIISSPPASPTESMKNHTSPFSFSAAMRDTPGSNSLTKETHDRQKIKRFFRSSSVAWQDHMRGRPPSYHPHIGWNQSRMPSDGIISAEEEECKVDGLPNHARSTSPRPEILGNFGLYEDRIVTQENKSRIVGLGWPNELGTPDSELEVEPLCVPEVERFGRTAPEGTGKGREGQKVAVTPEDLLVLLEYLKQCKGKLEDWRRRVEGMALDAELKA